MSTLPAPACCGSHPTLGIACSSLVPFTCELGQSLDGTHVPGAGGCPLKVDGSESSEGSHLSIYHLPITFHLCKSWHPQVVGVRQRIRLYKLSLKSSCNSTESDTPLLHHTTLHATNGLAERAVQTFKSFLKKSPSMPLEDALS